jgi:hypothetical protein
MNQTSNIVGEHLEQDFVDLRYCCLAAHGIAEYPLDCGERGFDIRALVLFAQKFLAAS